MYLEGHQDRLAKTAVLIGFLPPRVIAARHRPILDTFQIDKPLQGKLAFDQKKWIIEKKISQFYQYNWKKQSMFASLHTKCIDPVRLDMKSIRVVHCKASDTPQSFEQPQQTYV